MTAKVDSCNLTYWEDAYSIGNEKIDAEHKKLFELASKLNKCSDDREEVRKTVVELVKYTKFHFKNEENFMKSVGYVNLEFHKKLHKELIEILNSIIKDFKKKPVDEIVSQLTLLVNKNILNHILLEDKKVHHSLKNRQELKDNFRWKISYKLGDELLDKEHQKLFDIALKALDSEGKDIKLHVRETIKELYTYMKTHFEHEEKYMEKIEYPQIKEHKKLHSSIIVQMNNFLKLLPKLKIEDFEKKLIEYMDIWLISHILYEDKKIINYLEEQYTLSPVDSEPQ